MTVIKFKKPDTNIVRQVLENMGIQGDYSKITNDFRASINAVRHNADNKPEPSKFELIKEMINNPKCIPEKIKEYGEEWRFLRDFWIWFHHHIPIYYKGYKLVRAYEILALADQYNDPKFLQYLPTVERFHSTIRSEYPTYYRVSSKFKREKEFAKLPERRRRSQSRPKVENFNKQEKKAIRSTTKKKKDSENVGNLDDYLARPPKKSKKKKTKKVKS